MKIDVVDSILENCQNLGSKEDVATAILATIFELCPITTRQLFLSYKGFENKVFFEKDEDYFLTCGFRVSNSDYQWIPKKNKINFRPDIIISKPIDWEKKKKPINEKLISIESKLWTDLSPGQRIGYKYLADEFDSWNFLISMKKLERDKYNEFHTVITWTELLNDLSNVINSDENEKELARELFDLLKNQFIPNLDNFKDNKDIFCSKLTLDIIRWRTGMNGRDHSISFYDDEDCRASLYKFLKINNIPEPSTHSYIWISENTAASYQSWLMCLIYEEILYIIIQNEFHNIPDEAENKFTYEYIGSLKLNSLMDDGTEWFNLLNKINKHSNI